ncbi:MAG: 4Fe-4S binding protein, partial [Planctomycetota bacterium]
MRDGVVSGLDGVAKSLNVNDGPPLPEELPEADWQGDELEVIFRRDASVYDGRFANNSWLQEFPDPMTKLTWGNAALLGPSTAERLGVGNDMLVTLAVGERQVEIPAYIVPGVAAGTVVVSLGYGRTAAGSVGGDEADDTPPVGTDVYPLRTSDSMHVAVGATLTPTGRQYPLAGTQDHHAIDTVGRVGREKRVGVLIREATLDHYREHPDFARHAVHHPPLKSLWKEPSFEGYRWGMSIDLSRCTGCGACVLACQAENNVPVVGKKQVRLGREMHWLRVDRYFQGDPNAPRVAQQPLPCQQCELAPC